MMTFSNYLLSRDLQVEARDPNYIQNQQANDLKNQRRIDAQANAAQSRQNYQPLSPAMAALQNMRQGTGLDNPPPETPLHNYTNRPSTQARFGPEYWADRAETQAKQNPPTDPTRTQGPTGNQLAAYSRRYARPGDPENFGQPTRTMADAMSKRDETLPKNPIFGNNPNTLPKDNRLK